MKVQLNQIYVNRTRMYLARAMLSYFDKQSLHNVQILKPIMWGTYDQLYLQVKGIKEVRYKLFLLAEVKYKPQRMALKELREHMYYEDDYPMDVKNTKYVFIVFQIPAQLHKSYNSFMEGKFSEMFTAKELHKMGIHKFEDDQINPVYAVLTRKQHLKDVFKKKLEKCFDVQVSDEDLENAELDSFYVPPTYEAFNVDHYGPSPKE